MALILFQWFPFQWHDDAEWVKTECMEFPRFAFPIIGSESRAPGRFADDMLAWSLECTRVFSMPLSVPQAALHVGAASQVQRSPSNEGAFDFSSDSRVHVSAAFSADRIAAGLLRMQNQSTERLASKPAPPDARYPVTSAMRAICRNEANHFVGISKARLDYFDEAQQTRCRVLWNADGAMVDADDRHVDTTEWDSRAGRGLGLYVMRHDGTFFIHPDGRHFPAGVHSSVCRKWPWDPSAAGHIRVRKGVPDYLDRLSGHWMPVAAQLSQAETELRRRGVRNLWVATGTSVGANAAQMKATQANAEACATSIVANGGIPN